MINENKNIMCLPCVFMGVYYPVSLQKAAVRIDTLNSQDAQPHLSGFFVLVIYDEMQVMVGWIGELRLAVFLVTVVSI